MFTVYGLVDLLTFCRGMQDCFRQHPETYASEFEDDEEEVEEELRAREAVPAEKDADKPQIEDTKPAEPSQSAAPETAKSKPTEQPHLDSRDATSQQATTLGNEGGELVPKAAHDATS